MNGTSSRRIWTLGALAVGSALVATLACDASESSDPGIVLEWRLLAVDTLWKTGPLFSDLIAHRAEDGTFWLLDTQAQELYHARVDAEPLLVAARGEGPGELSRASALSSRGDTLRVHDRARGGATLLFVGGAYVATIPDPEIPDLNADRGERIVASLLGDGVAVVDDLRLPGMPSETDVGGLYKLGDGGAVKVLDVDSDWVSGMLTVYENGQLSMATPIAQPFSHRTVWSVSPHGNRAAGVTPDAAAQTYTVQLGDVSDPARSFRVTVAYQPEEIPSSVVDSIVEAGVRPPFSREDVSEELFAPRHYPPVAGVVPLSPSDVWVRRRGTTGAGTSWDVVDRDGLRARVVASDDVRVIAVEDSVVWGMVLDEYGEPIMVRFAMTR